MTRPVALIILDGWGIAPPGPGNAVTLAEKPVFDALWARYAHTQLQASGQSVGLPVGQIGNSEVGHLNLGAGRIVFQNLSFINKLIEGRDFFTNQILLDALRSVQQHEGRALHLLGLVSRGGVHSDLAHLIALLQLADEYNVRPVYIHAFLDGRDVGPRTAQTFLDELQQQMTNLDIGSVATVIGRYYAMDRDKRWDRTKRAYDAIVLGEGVKAETMFEALQEAYARGEGDEFVQPTVIVDEQGRPRATLNDDDSVIFFNFRADRARQLTYALLNPEFDGFERARWPHPLHYASLLAYADDINAPFAFKLPAISRPLGEVLSNAGKRQYRTAETEKYAHVTYFFNATHEQPYPKEDRFMVPSPKVATYDLQPEMSAPELARTLVERIQTHDDDFILINFANPDMVGHSGIIPAAVTAVETVDECLGQVLDALRAKGGVALVTADHGNCEVMIDPDTGGPHTAHTTNPVPFILVDDDFNGQLREGILGDVAPTILELMGLEPPPEMTGQSLIVR
ncbi:MAG TPA: 2,3-bisphosphoglycerate-independent phosphoglycerate mutase [Ardenticatenaceae bacterium]|nr:2,3-bisphosphoglycerate-independent phosphoglycerate mutase [Ardenticatenaceae bacterium]